MFLNKTIGEVEEEKVEEESTVRVPKKKYKKQTNFKLLGKGRLHGHRMVELQKAISRSPQTFHLGLHSIGRRACGLVVHQLNHH